MGTIVLSGAASGIGRRAAAQLTAAGWRTVVLVRSVERARGVVADATDAARDGGEIVVVPADLAELSQVRAAAHEIRAMGPVAAVINNAAVFELSRRRPKLTVDGIEETFAVNHVAPFVLVDALRPALADDAIVVAAASKGLVSLPWLRLDPGDLDSRDGYRPVRAYYRSKIAQLLFAAELTRRGGRSVAVRIPSVRLDDDKLRAYPAHLRVPYRLKARFAADPDASAAQYVRLVSEQPPTDARYVDERDRDVRWTHGTADPQLGTWLWERTESLAERARGPCADGGDAAPAR